MSEKRARKGEEVQGELEGLTTGDAAPGAPPPPRESRIEGPEGEPVGGEGDPERAEEPGESDSGSDPSGGDADVEPVEEASAADSEAAPDEEADRLAGVLETLERKVGRLIESHAELLERHRAAVAEAQGANERLERLREGGEDPEELLERIRALEVENHRVSEHAAFLEGRIQSLLTRVRYVVES